MDHLAKKDLEEQIIQVLKTVYDPEIPVDIYELGLIYNIHITDDSDVHIEMTLTSPNCPAAESMPAEIRQKIAGMELVRSFDLDIVFDPPWDKDMMSEEAKLELGFL